MTQTTALTLGQKKAAFVALFEKYSSHVMAAMPKHIAKHLTPERILQVMRLAMSRNPKLYECPPITVIGSMIQASQLGLSLDPAMNEAHLVPIWNSKTGKTECGLWQGYKAIEKLARNSGDVSTIEAECVYAKDEYKYVLGVDPVLEHYPSPDPDRGEIVATYAISTMRDGSRRFKWLWKHQTDAVKGTALARTKGSGPWVTHEAEMCKKTAKKRLGKDLPMSAEAQKAIALDDMADAGISQGLDALVVDDWSEEGEVISTLDKLTTKLDPKNKIEAEVQEPPPEAEQQQKDAPVGVPEDDRAPSGADTTGAPEAVPDEAMCRRILASMRKTRQAAAQQIGLDQFVGAACYDTDSDPLAIAGMIAQGKFVAAAESIMRFNGWQ